MIFYSLAMFIMSIYLGFIKFSVTGAINAFLPVIKGASVKGITFADGKKIIIAMIRKNEEDPVQQKCFLHEMAHIVLGHVSKDGLAKEDEKAAEAWVKEAMMREI